MDKTVQRAPALRLRERFGREAAEAVHAYATVRAELRMTVSGGECGKLARHYMMARADGWSEEIAMNAVRQFASSKRAVVYFREWCATVFNAESLAEHTERIEEELRDGAIAPDVMAAILGGRS